MKIFQTLAFVSIMAAVMAFAFFSGGEEALELDGSGWMLVSIDGEAILPGSEVTIFFEANRIHGKASCNNYFASYTLSENGDIEFGPAGSTMMFCGEPEGVMDQEFAFLQALAGVSTTSMDGDQLTLNGEANLVFQPILVD